MLADGEWKGEDLLSISNTNAAADDDDGSYVPCNVNKGTLLITKNGY
jgi:hypothetical protein